MKRSVTLAVLASGLAALTACSGGDMVARTAPHSPITTHPIVGQFPVPQGTTPTGGTGYAVAVGARTNGAIVQGTAAPCGPANAATYSDACAHAAGLPAARTPYISPYAR